MNRPLLIRGQPLNTKNIKLTPLMSMMKGSWLRNFVQGEGKVHFIWRIKKLISLNKWWINRWILEAEILPSASRRKSSHLSLMSLWNSYYLDMNKIDFSSLIIHNMLINQMRKASIWHLGGKVVTHNPILLSMCCCRRFFPSTMSRWSHRDLILVDTPC